MPQKLERQWQLVQHYTMSNAETHCVLLYRGQLSRVAVSDKAAGAGARFAVEAVVPARGGTDAVRNVVPCPQHAQVVDDAIQVVDALGGTGHGCVRRRRSTAVG